MTYEYFIGLPQRRIIRLPELRVYFAAETAWPNSARAKNVAGLPLPVQNVLRPVQQQWPARTPLDAQGTDANKADYTLGMSSVHISFDLSQAQAAHNALIQLAAEHGLLCLDCTKGGWLDAQKPTGSFAPTQAFTSERAVLNTVFYDDAALLLDPSWFVDGRFVCVTPGPSHFVQILSHQGETMVEYRSGPGRPVYRTRFGEMRAARALLDGYLRGSDMNTPENRFAPLSPFSNPDDGLPPRDPEGRWAPPPARPASQLHLT